MADKNDGFNELALSLDKMIGKVSESPLDLDFGRINADGSLRTNSVPIDIPSRDYLICENLFPGQTCSEGWVSPQRIAPGSRVLVAWVGNDAVVIDRIRNASEVV